MKRLIKYLRFEDDRVILIPTGAGLEYHKTNPLTMYCTTAQPCTFKEGTDVYAEGNALFALIAELPAKITHLEDQQNTLLNKHTIRAAAGGLNYHLNVPLNAGVPEVKPKQGEPGHKSGLVIGNA